MRPNPRLPTSPPCGRIAAARLLPCWYWPRGCCGWRNSLHAAPAPWYYWRSKVDGARVGRPDPPGPGWERDSSALGAWRQPRTKVIVVRPCAESASTSPPLALSSRLVALRVPPATERWPLGPASLVRVGRSTLRRLPFLACSGPLAPHTRHNGCLFVSRAFCQLVRHAFCRYPDCLFGPSILLGLTHGPTTFLCCGLIGVGPAASWRVATWPWWWAEGSGWWPAIGGRGGAGSSLAGVCWRRPWRSPVLAAAPAQGEPAYLACPLAWQVPSNRASVVVRRA